jgi:hypothetical protein
MKKIVLILIILVGCELKVGYRQNYFRVEKGEHKFKPVRVLQTSYRTLSWKAMFRDNCWYDAEQFPAYDRLDLNKLYGITSARIHQNSARIAWRAEKDSVIAIYAYWYINGKRDMLRLGETNTSVFDYYRVRVKDNKYVFQFNDSYHTVEGVDKNFWLNSYRTYPYFGGNQPSPHFMEIILNEK